MARARTLEFRDISGSSRPYVSIDFRVGFALDPRVGRDYFDSLYLPRHEVAGAPVWSVEMRHRVRVPVG